MIAPGSEEALRVLLVEDSEDDEAMLLHALRELRREVRSRRVDNEPDLRRALDEFLPHVVLSDYSMPGFSGHEALRLVNELSPALPFIFVSGTIGEEAAIEAVRRGAADYVFKDNLRRLPTAVENALRKFEERRERDHMERALRESEERFRAIVESTEDWVWEMRLDRRLTYSNAAVQDLLGYSPIEIVDRDVLDLLDEADRAEVERRLPEFVAHRHGWSHWRLRWRHRDGSLKLIESIARPLLDESGAVQGFRGIDRDVTLRTQHEAKIREMARIHAVLGALGNVILRARDVPGLLDMACRVVVEQGQFKAAVVAMPDASGRLRVVSRAGDERVTAMIEALGPAEPDAATERSRPLVRAFRQQRIALVPDFASSDMPSELRRETARVGISAQVSLPVGSPPWAALGLFAAEAREFDAEEQALLARISADLDYARDFLANSERLEFLAYRSAETGLPNRTAFELDLVQRLNALPGQLLVGAIDLVRAGAEAETRGRRFRDRVLAAVGERLEMLAPEATWLAHAGGNSFLFTRCHAVPLSECQPALDRWLRQAEETPVLIDGEQVHIALRCGVAVAPAHGRDFDAIERAAFAALSDAIRRDHLLSIYSDELRARAERRLVLERELRLALPERQFTLFLQPKFEARSRRLTGAEALLRWRHPQHGLVSPGEFVPLLEETGLIIPVGHWVMVAALEVLRSWRARGYEGYRIAINVSARELRQQGFAESCSALLEGDTNPGLDIEVTESLLMDDLASNVRVLNALREVGCRIAIDDFGTGYSSLNYLSRLPVDVLKVDQTFTAQIASSPDTLALVTNIISLAHSLDLRVVAEGVEEEEQEKLLRLLRCDELQGYLLGRPVPVDEFERIHLA